PPAITDPLAAIICLYSSSTWRVSSAGILGRFANSSVTRSKSDGGKLRRTGTASDSFRAAIRIAAFRAPAKDDGVAVLMTAPHASRLASHEPYRPDAVLQVRT